METSSRSWTLDAESELRFEVDFEQWVTVTLKHGTCEVLGIELAPKREYTFAGCKLAVFTWHGCEIETRGSAKHMYSTSRGETTMGSTLNAHAFLESRREKAARRAALDVVGGVYGKGQLASPWVMSAMVAPFATERGARGPRVMVVGAADSGKSTLCSTLVAYAARMSREPIFVDLDPSLNDCGVPPGAIGALGVETAQLSVEDGFGGLAYAPLAYWFGYESPSDNGELYRHVIDRLAVAVGERLASDPAAQTAGLVVNTHGWVDARGLGVLKHTVAAFAVDVILVLAHDRLYQDLKAAVPPDVVVANLPRSGGLVDRDSQHRRRARHKRVHEYFYGPQSHLLALAKHHRLETPQLLAPLAPAMLELRFRDVQIFKVLARDAAAVDSMLPVGQGTSPSFLSKFAQAQCSSLSRSSPSRRAYNGIGIPLTSLCRSTALVHNVLAVCHDREAAPP